MPADEQAIPQHTDPTDVFTVQLSGTKGWEVEGKTYQAGDVFYLPVRAQHLVRAAETEASLSIAYVLDGVDFHQVVRHHLAAVVEGIDFSAMPRLVGPDALARSNVMSDLWPRVVQ